MNDMMQLSGPSFGPASGGDADRLVILLHGYGADGNDLIGLAPHFAQVLPNAAFVSPNAAYPCEMGFGFQWFSIQNPDEQLRFAQVRQAADILNAFIDEQLAAHGVSEDRLALVGFSQGTMMSLYVAPRREKAVAGVMGYSGRLDFPDLLKAEIKSTPPVTLVHGDSDELLPINCLTDAEAGLKAAGMEVESHIRPGLGHGIDEVGLQVGMAFLKKVLG